MTHNTETKTYVDLLRERAADMAWQLDRVTDTEWAKGDKPLPQTKWGSWLRAIETSHFMSASLAEEICRELACQFLAFSNSRPKHLTILSAFRDREECIAEEDAALLRIKRACEVEE